MELREYLKEHIMILDGGMGTMLQKMGAAPGEYTETWNLTRPEKVIEVHKAYFDAGSNIVVTNTFGANSLHFDRAEMEQIITAGIENAKKAREESCGTQEKYVAFDIGPLGKILKPFGDLEFEDAVEIFAEMVRIAGRSKPDLFVIETMSDSYETKAALLAVKENSDLPVFVSNAYSENGRLMTGADAAAMVALLEGMGADAIGVNCSFGPDILRPVVEEYLKYASVPVLLKPNAGLPYMADGQTVYDVDPDAFRESVGNLVEQGVRIAGGCCGTTPAYISALTDRLKEVSAADLSEKADTLISSYAKAVVYSADLEIAEDCNTPENEEYQEALAEGDIDTIIEELAEPSYDGVDLLSVSVKGSADEAALLAKIMNELQMLTDVPFYIRADSAEAIAGALRRYNGKAVVHTGQTTETYLRQIFPLLKKYGGVLAAEVDAESEIARKVYSLAAEYGIKPKDLLFV